MPVIVLDGKDYGDAFCGRQVVVFDGPTCDGMQILFGAVELDSLDREQTETSQGCAEEAKHS